MTGTSNGLASNRRKRGWTQRELAKMANIHQPNLSWYERGDRFPSPRVIQRLAKAFDVRPATVYGWLTTPAEKN